MATLSQPRDRYCKHCSKPILWDKGYLRWIHLDYNAKQYVQCEGLDTKAEPLNVVHKPVKDYRPRKYKKLL